jgi:hypothetical protein
MNTGTASQNICTDQPCTPSQKVQLGLDTDLGSGGVVLLSPSQLVTIGKEGVLYLIANNSHNGYMGGLDKCGYACTISSDPTVTGCSTDTSFPSLGKIWQCFLAIPFGSPGSSSNGLRDDPAYWSPDTGDQYIYMGGLGDCLRAYKVSGNTFSQTAYLADNCSSVIFHYPSAGTSVSWDGNTTSSGIVWVLATSGFATVAFCYQQHGCNYPALPQDYMASSPGTLIAYAAVPVQEQQNGPLVLKYLWDSTKLTNYSTAMPGAVKFVIPTIAEGYVFIAGGIPAYLGISTTGCQASNPPPLSCAGQLTVLH